MNLRITPPDNILETRVTLPLSKSISNRQLIINALTPGASPLAEVAQCDDTDAMTAALAAIDAADINIGAAGTAMRFLTAYFATREGRTVTLDGSERMRHRPIGPLVDALRAAGAEIAYSGEEGFPPLRITGRTLAGGDISISASVSSQYISALLMVAPAMTEGLRLTLEGEIMSLPYIKMTLSLMEQRGADVDMEGNVITVRPGSYDASAPLTPEADWSAASFWYEITALTGGWVTVDGDSLIPPSRSLQGDSACEALFGRLGVTTSREEEVTELSGNPDADARLDTDMRATPDLVQPVVVTCAMLGIPFTISGLDSLRIKETDRLDALSRELTKIGVRVETGHDILHGLIMSWDGRRHPMLETPVFDTYEDHRMAMALAPVAAYIPGIVIRDAGVVSKSYPGYWEALREAGFIIEEAD